MKPETMNPAEILPHPLLTEGTLRPRLIASMMAVPKLRKKAEVETAAWAEFLQDVAARGVREPVAVTLIRGQWHVCDGRHRCLAAEEAGIPVPVEKIPPEEAAERILRSMGLRKHVSKASIAYQAVVCHPYLSANTRGRKKKSAENVELTREEVARQACVSLRLLEEAIATRQYLSTKPEERLAREAMILGGYAKLGAAKAGACGGEVTRGQPRAETDYYRYFLEGLRSLKKWGDLSKLKPEVLPALEKDVRDEVAAWTPETCELIAKALAARV